MSYKTPAYSAAQAFDPAASVFVSANAGAGKTSLLTNRVLALLLHGVAPSRLLCLTFTHAAAAEMSNRVLQKLGGWVMADDQHLAAQLTELLGASPDNTRMNRARSLFAKVLEAPEGVRIQTIHGFCQSLLKRFPIEAGVSPHFSVMDARTEQTLLQEACLRLFSRAQTEDPQLQKSLIAIAQALSESSFQSLLTEMIKNKRRMRTIIAGKDSAEAAIDIVRRLLKIPPDCTRESLMQKHFSYDADTLANLRRICGLLLQSDKTTDQDTGLGLARWLELPQPDYMALTVYLDAFLTEKGTKRKKLSTKGTLANETDAEFLLAEQERAWRFRNERNSLEVAERTAHVMYLAQGLLSLYDQMKTARALMDYDDLILTACKLLQEPGIAPWVLYKLDGGIDHILVDEAQDTSPEQWIIIDALTQEFFAGEGRKQQERSLFVVGDEKQSIYSFQGADPSALGKKKKDFSRRIGEAGLVVHHIPLMQSYRSTPEVLTAVDAVFAQANAREGLMYDDGELRHIATRLDHPGLVEIWPLISPEEDEEEQSVSTLTQLTRRIAATIRGWLDDGVILESKGRAVEAGDIMILVGKRTSIVDRLVRALKKANIPVAGHDRMELGENLAVQDLVALGQCLLLPEDNLTLAALLKSPIFNLSENEIYLLAWQREGRSLWECLKERASAHTGCAKAWQLLSDLRARADFVSPYELYSYLLDSCGARRRITGRMGDEYQDSIDEFLGQALLYERSHTPSLQGFLHWLNTSKSEIKRDMEQAKNCVRIMTVHGAKGLQAPIVILPDTVELPKPKDTLLWHNHSNGTMPLWPGSSQWDDEFCTGLRSQQKLNIYAEYRRLLYVALTRAEDQLFICGAAGKKNAPNELSWYRLVEAGLTPIARSFDTPWGAGLRVGEPAKKQRAVSRPQVSAAESASGHFAFLTQPAPAEPSPSHPLVPSRLSGEEPAAASPFADAGLFQRGNLIHRLLQYLPQVSQVHRARAAENIAAPFEKQLTKAIVDDCIREVSTVLADARFASLFSEKGLSEVPVAGSVRMDGKIVTVSGQIDRLYIGETDIWIVDFKSNRLPPDNLKAIPSAYIRQMQLYRMLLTQIYPGKTVRCALLWTATAHMSVLDDAQLDEMPLSSYI